MVFDTLLLEPSPGTLAAEKWINPPSRVAADRQRIPAAGVIAALEAALAVLVLAGVVMALNRHAVLQGFDSFFALRVTLKNVFLLVMLAVAWPLIFYCWGLYTRRHVRSAASERLRVCAACATGTLVALTIPLSSPTEGLQPASMAYFWLAATVSELALRQARRTIVRPREACRVLVVGTGRGALLVSQQLLHDDARKYEVVGFLDTPTGIPASEAIARQLLGGLDALEPLLMQHAIDEVHLALPIKSHYLEIQEALRVCEGVGVRTKYQAALFSSEVAWPHFDEMDQPTVTMHVVAHDSRLAIKRLIDLVGALAAIAVMLPLFAAVALAITLTSAGPVMFAQERYGLNRRRFRMFKFRTMRTDAEALQAELEALNEADGPVFKIANDPRVTRIGRFLRRTSIDELPQLFNVLRGEMSLVGPRPLPLRDVTRFTRAGDMRRFSVRPGLTCLWQISGRSELTFADWIRLDLAYIDRWSLAMDMVILMRTVPAVLRGTGAR
jgi:exopolysaccharide biosynthesis polyprenyl glycosylphosphotransferase